VGAVVLAIAVAIAVAVVMQEWSVRRRVRRRLASLASEQLLVELEKEFGIRIPDADAQTVHTIRDIVEYLDRRGVSP
jgi:hypothetical protein